METVTAPSKADSEQELTDKIVATVMERIASKNYVTWKVIESVIKDIVSTFKRGIKYNNDRFGKLEAKQSEIVKSLLVSETYSIRITALNRTIEAQQRQIEGLKIQVSELKRDKTPV